MQGRTRKEVAQFVLSAIRSFGIDVHPSSRIAQMNRLTMEFEDTIFPGEDGFDVLLEAERDFQMLEFIFEHLENARTDAEFRKLIGFITSDSALPQLDRGNAAGRNTQFHFFVSAMCQAGGMKPVRYEEPDVVCTFNDQRIGIAVKRIKSAKQMEKHIRKAIQQISLSAIPGVVALELTIALNPENSPFTLPLSDQEYTELHATYINWFLTPFEPRIRQWVANENVLGLVVHDDQIRLDNEGKWELSGMKINLSLAQSPEGQELFKSFFQSYTSALPALTRM